MATPVSSLTSYCSPAVYVQYHDWRQAADLLKDDDTRYTSSTEVISDPILNQLLLAASGEVEAACLVGNRYAASDLQLLTGASQAYLQKLVADLAHWRLLERRCPGTQPGDVAGAGAALVALDHLKAGDRVFAFQETLDAGETDNLELAPLGSIQEQQRPSIQADRFFGERFPSW